MLNMSTFGKTADIFAIVYLVPHACQHITVDQSHSSGDTVAKILEISGEWRHKDYDKDVRGYLNRNLPRMWIGCTGKVDDALMRWSLRSPDLTLCDFYDMYILPPAYFVWPWSPYRTRTAQVRDVTPGQLTVTCIMYHLTNFDASRNVIFHMRYVSTCVEARFVGGRETINKSYHTLIKYNRYA
jgi:hypothetical protein